MDEPESVVESIQTSAAVEGAAVVAGAAAETNLIVAAEVAQVDEHLVEHAELSEERHEEILEDTSWLQNQMGLLSTNYQALQSQLTAFQTAVLAKLELVQALLQPSPPPIPILSTDLSPSIPEPELLAVVEPEAAAVVDLPVPETPRPGARRRRVI